MRERPIIFSAPMVRAILEGRKTQTRRVVKPQPPAGHDFAGFTACSTCRADVGKAVWGAGDVRTVLREKHRVRCPYGQPGDRLWVREHWATDSIYNAIPPRMLPPSYAIRYLADGEERGGIGQPDGKDRRAFHMPRWASRITLEVTVVRVERLQDISEADAIAEGAGAMCGPTARDAYASLWDDINGPGSWAANPWVWVVEFRRIDTGVV